MDTKQRNGRSPAVPQKTANPPKKRKQPSAGTSRQPAREPARITPDVVYMPPKPFSRNRLILHLVTVTAVVVALLLGLSVFFKVRTIEISGTQKYSAWDIETASGIEKGDHLLTFSRARASGKIISALPYVKSVRIGIKLPDTVKIEIVEVEVTYAVKDQTGLWWLISSEGKVVEQAPVGGEGDYTRILGVQLAAPAVGQNAAAFQDPQPATDAQGNPVPVTVTAADRLKTALDLTGFLELNGIIGKVDSVDVNDLSDIRLWYDRKYQVTLGGTDQLGYKISCMKAAVAQLAAYEEGLLDLRDPDNILYTGTAAG